MKHAGPTALDRLEPMLRQLRTQGALKERSRGIFYRQGRAFLHFHEHGGELFADVRFASDFERISVTSSAERKALIARVKEALFDGSAPATR
jgi:hypothetical protein